MIFTKLYNADIFNNESLRQNPYYKKSIESKYKIDNIKYTDAMKMYKNINYYPGLFIFLNPQKNFKKKKILMTKYYLIFLINVEKQKKIMNH